MVEMDFNQKAFDNLMARVRAAYPHLTGEVVEVHCFNFLAFGKYEGNVQFRVTAKHVFTRSIITITHCNGFPTWKLSDSDRLELELPWDPENDAEFSDTWKLRARYNNENDSCTG